MAQYIFGTGQLFATPVGGGVPVRFGALQDVSVDLTADKKDLFGQNSFPLAVARGKTKIEGKAMTAEVNVDAYNSFFFGGSTASTGAKVPIFSEAGTVPATPFQITVANGATFYLDGGVVDALTGTPYTQIASGTPTTGQYKVSVAGVYTFAVADVAKTVLINYLYTDAAAGKTLTLSNTLMGVAPTFQLVLTEVFQSKTFVLVLYSCTSTKLNLPFKQDDFLVAELDFSAQDNGSGAIGFMSTH